MHDGGDSVEMVSQEDEIASVHRVRCRVMNVASVKPAMAQTRDRASSADAASQRIGVYRDWSSQPL